MNKLTGEPRKPYTRIPVKQFASEYVLNGFNGKKAIQKLDKTATDDVAENKAYRMLRKDEVQSAIDTALIKHDITLDNSIKPIAEALNANRVHNGKDEVYETDIPDYSVRLQASDRALKLLGVNRGEAPQQQFNTFVVDQRTSYNL